MRLALAATLASVLLTLQVAPGGAACASPQVEARPVRLAPGATISIHSTGWNDTCNDVGVCSAGACGSSEECVEPEPDRPTQDVVIELRSGSEITTLAQDLDADPETFSIEVEATLPDDLDPGRYMLLVHNGGMQAPEIAIRVTR